MSTRLRLALFTAACAGCLLAGAPAPGQDARPALPFEFEGKYLAVMLRSNRDLTHTLERVQLRKLGDHLFLSGYGVDTGSAQKGYIGLNVWVALSDVSEIQVYPTQDALRRAFAQTQAETTPKQPPKK